MPSGSTATYDDSVLFHILVSVVVSSIVRTASNGFSSPTGAFAVASNGLSETVSRVASAILSTSGLSFLGLGVKAPTPEWGAMLSGGRAYLRNAPHLTVFPGIAIIITILSLNLLGDGLRDALDPKLKK